jgi:shikimate-5-dehydrogenase
VRQRHPDLLTRAAVLGKPIAHSLSPVLHNAGYAAAGLTDWHYEARECAEAELAGLVGQLGPEWAGLSLTMPLKAAALAVADQVAPRAAAIGAANTLVRRPDGTWFAENTDVPGMVDALRSVGARTPGRVVVLGAGGTARAAVAAAAQLGATAVTVAARRPETVTGLGPVARACGVALEAVGWAQVAATLGTADLLISTVPAGAADALARQVRWSSHTVLLDVGYHPWPTPLATAVATAGGRVASGLDLLLAQGVRQFELFTGVPAPVPAMRAALARAAAAAG